MSSTTSLCVGQKLTGFGIPAGRLYRRDRPRSAESEGDHLRPRDRERHKDHDHAPAGDGNDCHWRGLTAQYCHCPLLTSGGAFSLTACGLFNGAEEMGVVDPRLWEHRGGSTHWLGGRLGKGVVHAWNKDLALYPTKLATGSQAEVDYTAAYIVLHATSANDKLGHLQISLRFRGLSPSQ